MRQDPASAASETYKLKLQMFENGKPEEFLQLMKDFKAVTDGTGTTSAPGKIPFLRTMLRGKLWENLTSSQVKLAVQPMDT